MEVSDYFAELYVAGRFADAGWNVYFPHRDKGFDFIISKPHAEVGQLIRPVQVKGKYPRVRKLQGAPALFSDRTEPKGRDRCLCAREESPAVQDQYTAPEPPERHRSSCLGPVACDSVVRGSAESLPGPQVPAAHRRTEGRGGSIDDDMSAQPKHESGHPAWLHADRADDRGGHHWDLGRHRHPALRERADPGSRGQSARRYPHARLGGERLHRS